MRTNRSVFNYLTSLTLVVATLATSVLTKRWLVAWLGIERLGAYRVGVELLALLSLLDLGLTGALMAMFARAVHQKDTSGLRSAFAVGLRAYFVVALLMFLGGLGMLIALPKLVNDLQPGLYPDMRLGFAIGLLGAALPLMPFRAIAEASQRGYIVNLLMVLQNLVVIGLSLLMAWLSLRWGWGISGQFLALFLAMLLTLGLLAAIGRRHHPGLWSDTLRRGGSERRRAWRQLFRLNAATMIMKVSGQLSTGIDSLVVNWIIGVRSVVPFTYTQQLSLMVQQQLHAVSNASWASLAELHFTGQAELFRKRLIELTRLVVILGVACLVPILAYNRRFVAIWIPTADVYAGFGVTALAAANALMMSLTSLWGWAFQGTQQIGRIVPVSLATMVVNLVLSVVCTYRFGVIGPLIGTVCGRMVVSLWWLPVLMRRHFGISVRALFGAIAWPLAVGLPYAAIISAMTRLYQPANFLSLGAVMASQALLYLGAVWLTVLDRDERALWLARCSGLVQAVRSRWTTPDPQAIEGAPAVK